MSMVLGVLTLPNPTKFQREFVETSSVNNSLTGRTTKDIRNRKEKFTLTWESLTPTEVSDILTIFNLETTQNFSVSETNLTISATPCHIDLSQRDYIKGGEFRTDLVAVLTEVV